MKNDDLNAYLLSHYTPATAERYRWSIDLYIQHMGGNAEHARYQDVWEHVRTLREKNHTQGHISAELAAVKAYHRYLVHTGIRTDNPTRDILLNDCKRNSRQIQHQDLFTPAELELLLLQESRYRILTNRSRFAVSLYIYQGITTGEMPRLTMRDVDLDEGTVIIRASRRLNSRILPLKSNQRTFLENYLCFDRPALLKEPTDHLFLSKLGTVAHSSSLHYLIECQRGLFPEKKLNPQTVRQSVIVNWLRQGHGIKEVQIMAGHRFPSTTEAYRPADLGKLSDAMGRFHPLG